MTFYTGSATETISLGEKIGALLHAGDVIAMTGTLAAGKTTITKGIARALGVSETITSPTFCIISEYEGTRLPLYHIDVYRLDSVEDFINLGVDDLLYGTGVCIIEWSEKIQSELPAKSIRLDVAPLEDGRRKITLEQWPYGDIPQ